MTTQRTLALPSPVLVDRLRASIAIYDAHSARLPGLTLAFTLMLNDWTRDHDWIVHYHAPYFDAKWGKQAMRERIREDLREYETGQPGRTVWTCPLEPFDDVLARVRVVAANG